MSFILDALKKSELERQRQNSPGLVGPSVGRSRQRLPPWALGLGALLAVNILVLVVFLARGAMQAPAAAASPAAASPTVAAPAVAVPTTTEPEPFSPLGGTRAAAPAAVYAPEIPVASQAAPSELAPVHAPRHRDPVLTDGDYKPADEEALPTVNELNLAGARALPELHLDVHVYATRPSERFVYINMRKYHEGAVLQEGPTVERIRRDGVILAYQDLRFLLPRQ